mgnify:CR=1 FL=1
MIFLFVLKFYFRDISATRFSDYYQGNRVWCKVGFFGLERSIHWLCDLEKLDLEDLLPVFFDGLRETKDPHALLADKGIDSLIEFAGDRTVEILP